MKLPRIHLKEKYSHDFNKFQKFCQKWFKLQRINKRSLDFKWGHFRLGWSMELILHRGTYFNPQYALSFGFIWGSIQLNMPWYTKLGEGCEMPQYGYAIHSNTLWIYRGGKFDEGLGQVTSGAWWSWYLPFVSWDFTGHWIFNKNNEWHFVRKDEYSWDYRNINGYMEEHIFANKLKNGDIQDRKAQIWKEKRQWARKWLPFWKKTDITIDIEFNDEVGERSGSWKGGVMGCGYTMKPNETLKQTFDRMLQERSF